MVIMLLALITLITFFWWIDKQRTDKQVGKSDAFGERGDVVISATSSENDICSGVAAIGPESHCREKKDKKIPTVSSGISRNDKIANLKGEVRIWKSIGLLIMVGIFFQLPAPNNLSVSIESDYQTEASASFYSQADHYINATFIQAFELWAAGRLMNKAVSIAQDVPVAGEALDPLNDTVERICTFLSFAMLALGGFKFILLLCPLASLKILLPFGVALRLISVWVANFSSYLVRFSNSLLLLGGCLLLLPTILVWFNVQVAKLYVDPQLDQFIDVVVGASESIPIEQLESKSVDESWLTNILPDGMADTITSMTWSAKGLANMLVSSDFYSAVIGATLGLFLKCMLMPVITFYALAVMIRFLMREALGYSLIGEPEKVKSWLSRKLLVENSR